MRIAQYLEDFPNYVYLWDTAAPFKKIWDNPQREHVLLFSNTMTIHRKAFEDLLSKYFIVELFELSNYFLGNAGEPFMFLRIVDTPVDSVKISFYNKAPHVFRDDGETFGYNKIFRAEQYTDEFLTYLDQLDSWRQTGVMPQSNDNTCEFRTVSSDEIRRDFVYTRYYEKHNDEIRSLLRDETICRLSDVADVEETSIMGAPNKIARVLFETNFPSYPYIPEKDSVEYPATSIRLRKNDIVEYRGKYFLYYHDTDIDIYAPLCTTVIRSKAISPEYLYFYLTGKTARRIQIAFSVVGGSGATAKPFKIQDFPIVLPTQDEQFYKDQFAKLAKPERVYEYIETSPESTLAALLKTECVDRLEKKNLAALKNLIENDFSELKICYDHKAYKTAIILAGSILEAFVIDWLSELDKANYFQDVFPERDDADQPIIRDGHLKEADLNYKLQALLARQARLGNTWYSIYLDADEIRKRRNNVHAKLSIFDPTHNAQSTCADVIQRLERVIKSRNKALLP